VSILLAILLCLLGIVGVVLLLVVLMPIGVRAVGAVEPWTAAGLVDVRWAWGFVGVRVTQDKVTHLRFLGLRIARIEGDDEKKKEKKARKKARKKEKPKKERKRGIRWAWSNQALVFRLLRALHFRGWIRGTVGLGDPADTAQLANLARLAPLRLPGFDTRLHWNYVDEALALEGAVQVRIWPAELVWILLATLARGGSRRALLASS
jgi:hypothetical protein